MGVHGIHAMDFNKLTATNTQLEKDLPEVNPENGGSRTFSELTHVVGALITTARDGCVIVGMVVPESVPVLELHGFQVESTKATNKIRSLTPRSTARAITNGELDSMGVTRWSYRTVTARDAKGIILHCCGKSTKRTYC